MSPAVATSGLSGLEMCSATPPKVHAASPPTPRRLPRAGVRPLELIDPNDASLEHRLTSPASPSQQPKTPVRMSPTAASKRKRSHSLTLSGRSPGPLSPTTSAGALDNEGQAETSPKTSPEAKTEKHKRPAYGARVAPSKRCVSKAKKRKVDAIENALRRFHAEETKKPRCAEFTALCGASDGARNRRKRKPAASMRVQVGVSLAQGARAYMEDRYSIVERLFEGAEDAETSPSLLAVYDGHNGAYASEYARHRFRELLASNELLLQASRRCKHHEMSSADVEAIRELLVDAFATVDDEILERTIQANKRDGSTVLLGLLVGGKMFVANLGDSRGVLTHGQEVVPSESLDSESESESENGASGSEGDEQDDENNAVAVRVSVDHKPDLEEESQRVEAAGGKVIFSGCWRVAHDRIPLRLAISRSLGDHPLKTNLPASCSAPLVSVVPDVRVVDMQASGEYLVFASDGLWDRLSDDDAAKIVHAKVSEYHWSDGPTPAAEVQKEALQFAANALVETALQKRSMDNITAMVMSFSAFMDASDDE